LSVIESNADLPDDVRKAVLGSRRQIIFIEGDDASPDRRLYQLIFENATTVPKGSCSDVIHAVDGIRGAGDLHWVQAFGLIDRDNRTPDEVAALEQKGVFALRVHSVEALYFGSVARRTVAEHQERVLGRPIGSLLSAAESAALKALDQPGISESLCAQRCEWEARDAVLRQLPKAADIKAGNTPTVSVATAPMLAREMAQFAALRGAGDLDGLLARYKLRSSRCFAAIADGLRFKSADDYKDAVVAKVQHDPTFRRAMSALLEPLVSAVGN
jgi:hypothetical protein